MHGNNALRAYKECYNIVESGLYFNSSRVHFLISKTKT